MGCCDGEEVCELVSSHILTKFYFLFNNKILYFYRGDGL